VSGYGLDDRTIEVRSSAGAEDFSGTFKSLVTGLLTLQFR
jgi:hypothetical protein